MKPELLESIQLARRAIRRASGLPLGPEEIVEEQRRLAVEAMYTFIIGSLGYKLMLQLKAECFWTEKGVAAQLRVDERYFHLRKGQQNDEYGLFLLQDEGERELIRVKSDDPLFADRILVAVGDNVPAYR